MSEAASPVVLSVVDRGPPADGGAGYLTISCCDHSQDGVVAGLGYKIA